MSFDMYCVIIMYSVCNDLELVSGLNDKRKQKGELFLSLKPTLGIGLRARPKIASGYAGVYQHHLILLYTLHTQMKNKKIGSRCSLNEKTQKDGRDQE